MVKALWPTIGGVAAPVIGKTVGAVGKYGKAAVTEGIPAAVKTGVGAAVKEGLEWTGGSSIGNAVKNAGKLLRGEELVAPTTSEIVKPAIAHAVPGGYGVAAVATAGKGKYERAKAGIKATKDAVSAAGSQPKPQWSNLFDKLKSNPETSETAAQELFTAQQTSSAARAQSMDRPAYMRREKIVQEPVVAEPVAPPPKPAGPTPEQLAGKKPAPVVEQTPEPTVQPEPTVNKPGRFASLKEYMKNEKVEKPPVVESPVNSEVVTPDIADDVSVDQMLAAVKARRSAGQAAPESVEPPTRGSSMTVDEARNAIRKRALENGGDPVDALNAAFGGRPMTAKLTADDKEKAFDIIARRGTGNDRESVKKYNGSKYKTIQDVYDEIYGTKG